MPDLAALFRFSVDPLELVVRGVVMYGALFLLFRFVLRRDAGALGIADLLLLVLIADAAQNAMAGGYDTVSDGLLLVGTIAGCNWLMDWASYRYNAVRRFMEGNGENDRECRYRQRLDGIHGSGRFYQAAIRGQTAPGNHAQRGQFPERLRKD